MGYVSSAKPSGRHILWDLPVAKPLVKCGQIFRPRISTLVNPYVRFFYSLLALYPGHRVFLIVHQLTYCIVRGIISWLDHCNELK